MDDWMHDCDLGVLPNMHGSGMDEIAEASPGSLEAGHTVVMELVRSTYEDLAEAIVFPMPEDPADDELAAGAIAALRGSEPDPRRLTTT